MVAMKLRTGFPNKEISYTFGINPTRVTQIFHEWLNVMA